MFFMCCFCASLQRPGVDDPQPVGGRIPIRSGGQQVQCAKIHRSARTPDPLTFKSVDDILDAYLEQVRFFFNRLCKIENTSQTLYERYLPRPFYSALLDGCIEKGQDCRKWAYPSAVADFCIILGPTNVADAISAMKKNIFDDKKISMEELLKALADNWEGHEHIR